MNDSFDAYHKWLGIPPKDQPPHHYRLLGLEMFESDTDVIESAANQRMSYLQDLAIGERVADSQKLLNEVARARRILLNPAEREAYDATLRQSVPAARPTRSMSGKPPSPPPEADKAEDSAAAGAQKNTIIIALSLLSLVIFSSLAYVFMSSTSLSGESFRGRLVIKWPLNERQDARIKIDGETRELTGDEIIEIPVKEGRRQIYLQRAGFRPIDRTIVFTSEPVRLRPNWQR